MKKKKNRGKDARAHECAFFTPTRREGRAKFACTR